MLVSVLNWLVTTSVLAPLYLYFTGLRFQDLFVYTPIPVGIDQHTELATFGASDCTNTANTVAATFSITPSEICYLSASLITCASLYFLYQSWNTMHKSVVRSLEEIRRKAVEQEQKLPQVSLTGLEDISAHLQGITKELKEIRLQLELLTDQVNQPPTRLAATAPPLPASTPPVISYYPNLNVP